MTTPEHLSESPLGRARRGVLLGVLAVVLAAGGLGWGPSASAAGDTVERPAALALVVTPSTMLLDQQTVTVEGSGYAAGASVYVLQCVSGLGVEGCDQSALAVVTTEPDGTFSVPVVVSRLLKLNGEVTDCAVEGACVIGAGPDVDTYASSPIQFDPDQPLPPEPSIVAEPDTGLVDRQLVTVTGSNFDSPGVAVLQCLAGAIDPGSCATVDARFTSVDDTGGFVLDFPVRRILATPAGTVDCAVADACAVAATEVPGLFSLVLAPIAFDPNGPLPVPPSAAVVPSTGLVDGQAVTVTATGFDPMAELGIIQCVTGGPPDGAGCDVDGLVQIPADELGAARVQFTVRASLATELGPIDCTTGPEACVVVVVSMRDLSVNVQIPISFAVSPTAVDASEVVAPAYTG
jgi:hypothetical protein